MPAFSNFLRFEERFRVRLVLTVGLTIEKKAAFSSFNSGRGLREDNTKKYNYVAPLIRPGNLTKDLMLQLI